MSNPCVDSPAKCRMEDRVLFIGVPSLLPAGISIWMQHHFGSNLTGLLAVLCVFLYSLPFLALIAINFLYFREERDEFQTQLLSGAMLCGIGGTLLVTTLWGAMEQFHLVPVFHAMWVMPMFGLFYSFALAVQRWRYR